MSTDGEEAQSQCQRYQTSPAVVHDCLRLPLHPALLRYAAVAAAPLDATTSTFGADIADLMPRHLSSGSLCASHAVPSNPMIGGK